MVSLLHIEPFGCSAETRGGGGGGGGSRTHLIKLGSEMPPGVLRELRLLASAVMMSGLRGLYGRFWFLLLQLCGLFVYFEDAPKAESGILRFERRPTLSPMGGSRAGLCRGGSEESPTFFMVSGMLAAYVDGCSARSARMGFGAASCERGTIRVLDCCGIWLAAKWFAATRLT